MKQLIEALEDAPSVIKISYSTKKGYWTIKFNEKQRSYESMKVATSDLIYALKNV